jgi:uncharacterized protein with FMN-binding domain
MEENIFVDYLRKMKSFAPLICTLVLAICVIISLNGNGAGASENKEQNLIESGIKDIDSEEELSNKNKLNNNVSAYEINGNVNKDLGEKEVESDLQITEETTDNIDNDETMTIADDTVNKEEKNTGEENEVQTINSSESSGNVSNSMENGNVNSQKSNNDKNNNGNDKINHIDNISNNEEKNNATTTKSTLDNISKKVYRDGIYSGSSYCIPDEDEDFEAYNISLKITIENDKIVAVSDVYGDGDSGNASFISRASNGVISQIISKGNAMGVDTVSGATCTSKSIIEACQLAMESAKN